MAFGSRSSPAYRCDRSRPGAVGERGYDVFEKCWDAGVFVRPVGDSVAFCPPLIAQKKHLDQMFNTVAEVLRTVG